MDDNDSLQHLKDAEVIEFDIKNDEPGVKHTTDAGDTNWRYEKPSLIRL